MLKNRYNFCNIPNYLIMIVKKFLDLAVYCQVEWGVDGIHYPTTGIVVP